MQTPPLSDSQRSSLQSSAGQFRTPRRPSTRPRLRDTTSKEQLPVARLSWSFDNVWDETEVRALVQFVLLMCQPDRWPTHKRMVFWNNAGKFVQNCTRTLHLRSGNACRYKVVGFLHKKYASPKEAEDRLKESPSGSSSQISNPISSDHMSVQETTRIPTQSAECQTNISLPTGSSSDLVALSKLFSELVGGDIHVPEDYLIYTAQAMNQLSISGRSNVLYKLSKAIGTMRPDNSDSCFPCKRMPMGMLEYMADFFASTVIQQVKSCPQDYRAWQQTMYANFGQKWSKLHHGPLWSFTSSADDSTSHSRIVEAKVNIPGLSERTLRRDFEKSGVSVNSDIQLKVLDAAASAHPNSWFWVKADGVDVVAGLGESLRLQWTGDVDLNDGELSKQYQLYRSRLAFVGSLISTSTHLLDDLEKLHRELATDLAYIVKTLQEVNKEYETKQKSGKYTEKVMFSLAWNVRELEHLNSRGRNLRVEISTLLDKLKDPSFDRKYLPSKLDSVKNAAEEFVKGVIRQQRVAATHCLVIMISPEERNKKPYAFPVQCIPYKGLKDRQVREITNKVISEMTKRKMKVAGLVTNGEWNSLRTTGNKRPLSVFQIRSNVRSKYSRLGETKLMKMITPVFLPNGMIVASEPNPAVSATLLKEILLWKLEGCSNDDVIIRLRQRTVPEGYKFHQWITGKEETKADKLRSILAQMEFSMIIKDWEKRGVNFIDHLYVPEQHPVTGEVFCEMEDEGHVFKRIGTCLRLGSPSDVRLERFVEAVQVPESRLTHTALVGSRKQSVEDVERLFGLALIKFMEEKQYSNEAKYLTVIRNWRRAVDERGLPDATRQLFNKELLDFILDDLMPWHRTAGMRNFSLLEVNREITGIKGFTREVLIALVADIESREWRSQHNHRLGIPAPHPRSCTTDDVECFFSIMRDSVGKDFTLKQVFYEWRKVCVEFSKRSDPDLPFYYHTTSDRFYEGNMPAFDEPSEKPKQPKRVPRREQVRADVNGRVTMAIRGDRSIQTTFHNLPIELPPPPLPNQSSILSEHAYASTGPK